MRQDVQDVIVMTGASGGIGVALAHELARPNRKLVLIARDREKLEALAAAVSEQSAAVETAALDVRDRDALHSFLADLDARHPVDMIIANAGVTAGLGPNRSREGDAEADWQLDINYRGAVNTVTGVVEAMRSRGRGQIVLVASLAGMRALPDMPSYSASKAAVIAYGHSLRGWLKPFGVDVSIICPGFVTTPMSARHKGSKPFEMSAEKAARKMRQAIERKRAFYAFPFVLATGIWLQNLLPARISDLFLGGFKAEIEEDPRFRK
ncbi:SDR family NAD(P)-dependent oxidoreductase [Roseibium polysiphoniae]|uniref:SDR family NAD(P)-dependent oxidoreductase n=1 Tax=Roseibium polysiphoniae TaxID=2571221 RepID=UPI003298ECA3